MSSAIDRRVNQGNRNSSVSQEKAAANARSRAEILSRVPKATFVLFPLIATALTSLYYMGNTVMFGELLKASLIIFTLLLLKGMSTPAK